MRIDMKFCRPACSPFKALFSRKAEFANLRCSRGSDAKFVCASLKSATSELVFYNVASCHPNTVAEQSRTGCLARSVTRRCSKRLFKNLRPKAISGDSEEEGAKSDHASSLLDALQQQPLIGSEYGEGFIQYRISGESSHLDVDTLNEKLKLKGAERMRTAMRPDEAFGMIFSWDGVIADMQQLQYRAWQKLAVKHGEWMPQHRPQILKVRPERAITEVLHWTRDWKLAQKLAYELTLLVEQEFKAMSEPLPGVLEWLQALRSVHVPCALATNLERTALLEALQRMGLRNYFTTLVTAEDGMETTSQRILSSAIKLGRPPQDCVVFESNPYGVAAAHNCSCKVVAVQGVHPGYRLQQADVTCKELSELSIYNIRRLFANRGSDFMDKKKVIVPNFGGNNTGSSWRIANGTLDP